MKEAWGTNNKLRPRRGWNIPLNTSNTTNAHAVGCELVASVSDSLVFQTFRDRNFGSFLKFLFYNAVSSDLLFFSPKPRYLPRP